MPNAQCLMPGMVHMIEPRTLRGFRDFLPQQMIPKEQMLEKA